MFVPISDGFVSISEGFVSILFSYNGYVPMMGPKLLNWEQIVKIWNKTLKSVSKEFIKWNNTFK